MYMYYIKNSSNMQNISYTSLRKNLSSVMNLIEANREEVQVTRKGHETIIMMSQHDYESMQETLYLLSNPNNAKRLQDSINQAKNNEFTEVDWDES